MRDRYFHRKALSISVLLLLVACLFMTKTAFADQAAPPVYNWLNRVYLEDAGGTKIIQLADGSALTTDSYSAFKLNSLGEIEWKKQFIDSGLAGYVLKDLCPVKAGGYVALAVYGTDVRNVRLITLDSLGNRLSDKPLVGHKTGENTIELSIIRETEDGGFILGGSTTPENGVAFLKVDAQGDKEWLAAFKADRPQQITGLLPTNAGSCVVIGNSLTEYTKPAGDGCYIGGAYRDGFILKLDQTGQVEWKTHLNEANHTSVECIQETGDNGFIIGGGMNVTDDKSQAYLLTLNGDGTIKWRKTIPSEASVRTSYVKLSGGNSCIVLAGPLIFKVDQNGNIVWEKTTVASNSSVIETPDGYLVVGSESKPPGIYFFHAIKLSLDTPAMLQRNYPQLSAGSKAGYILNLYDAQASRLKQNLEKIKRSKMTVKDKAYIDRELAAFDKTVTLQRNMEASGSSALLLEYLYRSPAGSLSELRLQYNIQAEVQVDKHLYISNELQRRFGNKSKVAGVKMDGIIVWKNKSFYTLDLRNVSKYTITANRIEIVTNKKTYFLRTDYAERFPTYAGLGLKQGNMTYVFDTSKLKKPVVNDWIKINDVVKFLVIQPKRKNVKYKDLTITKEKGEVYTVKIARVYNGPNHQYILPGTYLDVTTKAPAVTYSLDTADSAGANISDPTAVVKFKGCTIKITLL